MNCHKPGCRDRVIVMHDGKPICEKHYWEANPKKLPVEESKGHRASAKGHETVALRPRIPQDLWRTRGKS